MNKKLAFIGITISIWVLFVGGVALFFGGCEPCFPAAKRAARHGIVLDCKKDKSDSRRDVCTVSTKDGDVDYHYWRCDQ